MSTMRAYTREFRESAVGMVLSEALSIRKAADDLRMLYHTLHGWVRAVRRSKRKPVQKVQPMTKVDAEARVRELGAEVRKLMSSREVRLHPRRAGPCVQVIDSMLHKCYDWQRAPDTSTTWRIGDGTAAIYNYICYTVAGFTEHDTFRSHQIREGDLTRDRALALVEDENRPRYPNLKWYLDAIGMDFEPVFRRINGIPRHYA